MIRVAVVEDDSSYADQLVEFLGRYEKESREALEVTVYRDGDEITENYRGQFDIILMDIQMRFMDGMSAAEEIRKKDSEVVIIFITNMAQYAIRGYEVEAFDYVMKPISYFAFSQKFGKAAARMKKREEKNIALAVKDGVVRLRVSDIYYVESMGHTLIYHTASGNYEAHGAMKEAEDRFGGMNFFRGNKGYLINLAHVDGVQEGCAIVNGEKLLISRPRKNAFLEALAAYWGEVIK